MADSGNPTADVVALIDGYEQLRAAVLEGGPGGWRLGHGLLSVRGMTALIDAFDGLVHAAPASLSVPASSRSAGTVALRAAGHEPSARPPLVLHHGDQLVAVLTQMVLPLAV